MIRNFPERLLEKFGGLDSLVYKEIPDPEPKIGYVVIEIKAFGINHAEMHMRRGEWAEAAEVSGIECVGLVKSCPGGEFPVGAKVAALMGGLGRTINGSYGIDALLNIAGAVPQIDLFEMTDEQWEGDLALKLHGARRLTIAASPMASRSTASCPAR